MKYGGFWKIDLSKSDGLSEEFTLNKPFYAGTGNDQ
jgi:hypothetical protein